MTFDIPMYIFGRYMLCKRSIVKHAVYVVSNREILSKCIPVIGCYLFILTPLTQFSSQLSLSWLVWRGTYLPHKWHFFIARRTLRVYFLWSKLQPNHQLSVWPIAFIPRPEQYAQWGKFASEGEFILFKSPPLTRCLFISHFVFRRQCTELKHK